MKKYDDDLSSMEKYLFYFNSIISFTHSFPQQYTPKIITMTAVSLARQCTIVWYLIPSNISFPQLYALKQQSLARSIRRIFESFGAKSLRRSLVSCAQGGLGGQKIFYIIIIYSDFISTWKLKFYQSLRNSEIKF